MTGQRFTDDPLVTVSGQFPLNPFKFTRPTRSEPPSGPSSRPYALRWLVDMGVPSPSESYRYCPVRQVAVHVDTGEPRPPLAKLDWTTIATKDGDEGPSKDYGWETVPDDDGS
jgi:putative ATP-grasp target RiPP